MCLISIKMVPHTPRTLVALLSPPFKATPKELARLVREKNWLSRTTVMQLAYNKRWKILMHVLPRCTKYTQLKLWRKLGPHILEYCEACEVYCQFIVDLVNCLAETKIPLTMAIDSIQGHFPERVDGNYIVRAKPWIETAQRLPAIRSRVLQWLSKVERHRRVSPAR